MRILERYRICLDSLSIPRWHVNRVANRVRYELIYMWERLEGGGVGSEMHLTRCNDIDGGHYLAGNSA